MYSKDVFLQAKPRRRRSSLGRPKRLCLYIALVLQGGGVSARAAELPGADAVGLPHPSASLVPGPAQDTSALRFNGSLFRDASGQPIDVARFAHGNPVMPGRYEADLYVNGAWVAHRDIDVGAAAQGEATVCLTRAMLTQAGLDITSLPDAARAGALVADGGCADPADIVPGAGVRFDMGELRVDLDLPQAYLRRHPRGYVDPQFWDAGVTAGILSYDANFYRNQSDGRADSQGYVGLDAGVNAGGWQLRHQGNLTVGNAAGGALQQRYAALNTYVRHDVTALQARFLAGQSYTPGDLFDGFGFTGLQLTSDDRMLPDSLRSYAPVVRGVASSNAKVTVRQGSNVLYETTVAPGPFVIDDLFDTGYAGDLTVTVTEADGSSHSFVLPYASIPQLLRPGTHRFSVTAGVLRDDTPGTSRPFVQGTYRRGISNALTLYGGITAAEQYQTVLAGAAFSTPVGAIAADIAQSWTQSLSGPAGSYDRQGQSYRVTYNKRITATDTNFTLGAYRYSSQGYQTFVESEQTRVFGAPSVPSTRHRLQLNLSQPLAGNLGSLYFNGYVSSYWGGSGTDVSFAAGYTRSFAFGTLNLNVQRSRSQNGSFDNQIMAAISLPLGKVPRAPVVQARVGQFGQGQTGAQLSVTGVGNDSGTLSYNAYVDHRHTHGDDLVSGGGGVSYLTPVGTLNVAASAGAQYSQISAGFSGTAVAHPRGVTLSQRTGEAVAIIEAPGAEGASVLGSVGARVNGAGFAVLPTLSPYRMNEVGLDADSTRDDVDVLGSTTTVAPRSGAVVMVKFKTERGRAVMLRAIRADGKPVPTAADVWDASGKSVAAAGQGGLIYLRSEEGDQRYTVTWGREADERCVIRHTVTAPPAGAEAARANAAVRVRCEDATASMADAGPDATHPPRDDGAIH